MSLSNLSALVLQHHGARSVQHSKRTTRETRGMLSEARAAASRFDANHSDRCVLQHFVEKTDGIRAAADAGDGDVRRASDAFLQLPERLASNDRLKVAHDHWIRMRAEDGADDVVR